jgi:type I restriction enzyme R subunit
MARLNSRRRAARKLLQNLKEAKLVLDWRKKLRTRADGFSTVKTVLDDLPRVDSTEVAVHVLRVTDV